MEATHLINEQVRTAQIPQTKKIFPEEFLGCTLPFRLCGCYSEEDVEGGGDDGVENNMKGNTVILFLPDGQLHLEAEIISNLYLRVLRYDTYGKILKAERYNTKAMKTIHRGAIEAAGIPNSSYP